MDDVHNTWIYPYCVFGARAHPNGLMASIWFWWLLDQEVVTEPPVVRTVTAYVTSQMSAEVPVADVATVNATVAAESNAEVLV